MEANDPASLPDHSWRRRMSRVARVSGRVPIGPEAAVDLWSDLRRWPSFVEGFARVLEQSGGWPDEGARVVWESGPGGRGRVTEKVTERAPRAFASRVAEERLIGVQSFGARAAEDGEGSVVELALDYELTSESPLRGLTDALFVRRALRDALGRTLSRYRVEAEEDAGLR